jgi:hypothetical protein
MIGGETDVVKVLDPIFGALALGIAMFHALRDDKESRSRTASRFIALWRIIRRGKSQIGTNLQ